MGIRIPLAATAMFSLACASSGNGGDLSQVMVYLSSDDVPCEFEVIGQVSGFAAVSSLRQYERERDRILGREGARAGADAVLIPDTQREPGRDGGLRVTQVGGVPQQTEARFSGQAIRFTSDDCGASG